MNKEKTHGERHRSVGLSFITAALILVSCLPVHARADSVVVIIVNASNPVSSLTLDEVHQYYDNDHLHWPPGNKVTLYDLKINDASRNVFSQTVLGQTPQAVATEWANKKITNMAKNPPRTVTSAILMQARVGKDPGAIGYLRRSEVTSDQVKIVAVVK